MGNEVSAFTESELEILEECTFFNRKEIKKIHRFFRELCNGRPYLTKEQFMAIAELKCNPFRERIAEVFSADGQQISFDDFLDFLSVFSEAVIQFFFPIFLWGSL